MVGWYVLIKKYYQKAKLLRSWGGSSSLYDEQSEKIENRFNIKLEGIRYDKKFVFEEIGHKGTIRVRCCWLMQLKN